jgi:arginyl-tRNA synthetase
MMSAREELLDALRAAMAEVVPGHTLAAAFETPRQADHGDFDRVMIGHDGLRS